MKRIFVILLFFVSLSVMAEELYPLKDDVTDISNKSWYFVTNSPNAVDEFLFNFNNKFVKKTIATIDNYNNLSGQDLSIFNSLKNRWYTLGEIPSANFIVVINCSENHGILYFLWNDTQSFGSFSSGLKTMMSYLFELNPPK